VEVKKKIIRLRWLGHMAGMVDNRLPKKLFIWEGPHTKRPRGQPRIMWKDEVYKDARRLDKNWKGVINDREQLEEAAEKGKESSNSVIAK
jgi:hypothetical protein